MSCAPWMHARDVSILGGDDAQDVLPSQVEGVSQPIHALCIVAMGMPIFDNLDLELVGREAEKRKRWEFLVTASPAAVPGATGSVLNPIADVLGCELASFLLSKLFIALLCKWCAFIEDVALSNSLDGMLE